MSGTPILRVTGLFHRYTRTAPPALDGIDLHAAPGEVLGVLGPNGAGKTTAVSICCTLMRPTAGRVEICGEDALAHAPRVRGKIGLVPQEIALYPTLTARENLRYFGALYGLGGSRLAERVERCLHWVEMEEHAGRRVETYSGGMKRRVNFAAALLHEPRLIFLDEPTVGIDAHSRRAILDRLLELRRAGVTLVYTTHYMEEAEKLCDRIAVIDRGRIVAQGAPADLLARHPGCADLESLLLGLTDHDAGAR